MRDKYDEITYCLAKRNARKTRFLKSGAPAPYLKKYPKLFELGEMVF